MLAMKAGKDKGVIFMKKMYTSPVIEIESYNLSDSIAANCKTLTNFGPGVPGTNLAVCDGFIEIPTLPFSVGGNDIMSASFYDGTEGGVMCDCYYTAGGEGYFSS